MAKVGRAARVASKQRTETITASKTIGAAETGEMYLINHNAASAVTITLPSAADGAYFKFLFIASMTDGDASLVITTNGTDRLVGTIFCTEDDGTDAINKWDDGSDDTKVTLSDDINRGSWVEVVSDGSAWYITGMVDVPASTNASNVAFA